MHDVVDNEKIILYLFFGGITTFVNYLVFFSCIHIWELSVLISNTLAWLISVLVAFITNKTFVFRKKSDNIIDFLIELVLFFTSRVFSGFSETAILIIGINLLGINDVFMKIIASIFVVIFNYVFSINITFKK